MKILNSVIALLNKDTSKGVLTVGLGKIITILLGVSTIALSARSLGPQNFGRLTLFFAMVEISTLISMPGFNLVLQKSIHKKNPLFFFTAVKMTSLWACIGGPFLMSALYFINKKILFFPDVSKIFWICSLLLVILKSVDKSEVVFAANKEFKGLASFNILNSFTKFLGVGVSSYIFQNINNVIYSYISLQVITSTVSYLVSAKLIKKKILNSSEKPSHSPFIKDSYQLSALALFNIIATQIDKLLIFKLSPVSLGLYTAGTAYPEKIREVLKSLLAVITNTWLSYGDKEFKQRTKNNAVLIISGALVGILILFMAPYIYIPLILGKEYLGSIQISQYMGVIAIVKTINYFLQSRDIVFEKAFRHQTKVVFQKIVYITLLLLLLTKMGVNGVLLSIFLSELLLLSMYSYDLFKSEKI